MTTQAESLALAIWRFAISSDGGDLGVVYEDGVLQLARHLVADGWTNNDAPGPRLVPATMCACGHTLASHSPEGCWGCAGPECDFAQMNVIARRDDGDY